MKHAQGWGSSSPGSGVWGWGVRCQNEVPVASPAQLSRLGDACPGISWWHSIKGLCELQSVCKDAQCLLPDLCYPRLNLSTRNSRSPGYSRCPSSFLKEEAGLTFPPGTSRSLPSLTHSTAPPWIPLCIMQPAHSQGETFNVSNFPGLCFSSTDL